MATSKPTSVDEYIAGFPEETQAVLARMRSTIREAAPGAEETISYGMPTFKVKGKYVVYFAGYKKHVSIYPAPRGNEAFAKELSVYKGGKGTVQFPLDESLPLDLIRRIVNYRIKETLEKPKK